MYDQRWNRPQGISQKSSRQHIYPYQRKSSSLLWNVWRYHKGIKVNWFLQSQISIYDHDETSFKKAGLHTFQEGDIVELQLSFIIVPLRQEQKSRMNIVLRSISLLDGKYTQASECINYGKTGHCMLNYCTGCLRQGNVNREYNKNE